jgi:hypothetical protein
MAAPAVFAYLPDELIEAVECNDGSTIYLYGCGCKVVLWVGSDQCYVEFCPLHRLAV